MKREECFNHLLQIQKRYPVEKWMIGNVHVWPIIRVYIMDKMASTTTDTEHNPCIPQRQNRQSCFSRWCGRIHILWYLFKLSFKMGLYRVLDWPHNDTLKKKVDLLCLSFSAYRATKINGYYYLKNMQSFLDLFPSSSACIMETLNDQQTVLWPRYGKSVFIDDLLEIDLTIGRWDLRSFKKKSRSVLEIHLPCWQEVNSYLINHGWPTMPLSVLEKYIQSLLERKNIFKNYLKNISPKLVIIECYYGPLGEALVLACNELNIPSADLQHGTQHAWHPAYSSLKPTSTGYNSLPRFFLVWSEAEKQSIERWSFLCPEVHTPLVIGNVWEDLWEKEEMPAIFHPYVHAITKLKKSDTPKYHILFTLDHNPLDGKLVDIINQSPENWCWWIRMHPGDYSKWEEMKRYYSCILKHQNISLKDASEWPLPALLQFIDLHITKVSTVALECAAKSIPSIMLEGSMLKGYERYASWIEIVPLEALTVSRINDLLNSKKRLPRQKRLVEHPDIQVIEKIIDLHNSGNT